MIHNILVFSAGVACGLGIVFVLMMWANVDRRP